MTINPIDCYRSIDGTVLTRITIDSIREPIESKLPAEWRHPFQDHAEAKGVYALTGGEIAAMETVTGGELDFRDEPPA
ncbi:hypothetical protein HNR46_001221 [Haloferula luteola]|uniref:Uncharacterized protein n=1 Tax=Haloferula luteola TaxID=595692 RepID=A0A840UXV8_9BACT|nr:hypothetical protein [Haloferula luteola]MBB5350987.1 hypothetical protein [Haloferula luteola]